MVKYQTGRNQEFGTGEAIATVDISQFPELNMVSAINQIIERKRGTPWGVRTGGSISSKPLYYKGALYFGANDHNFYALDAQTGKEIWRFGTDDLVSVYSSPAIWRERIIFSCYSGRLYCMSLDGKDLHWRFNAEGRIATTPLIHNDRVYFGSRDQNFYAISAESGKLIWKLPLNQEIVCSPIGHDGSIYFASREEVYRITRDGRIIWRLPIDGDINHICARGDMIYFGASDRNIYAITTRGQVIWRYSTGGPVIPEVMLSDGRIFVGSLDFNLYCLDFNGNLKWRFPTGDIIATKCLGVDKNIVFSSFDKLLYCVTGSGKLLWKVPLEIIPYMIFENDVIFAPGWDCKMRALDKKGRVLWEFHTSLSYQSEIEFEPMTEVGLEVVHVSDAPVDKQEGPEEKADVGNYGDFRGSYIGEDMRDYIGKPVDRQGLPGMAYRGRKGVYRK
jgi:outer membrane protein assembly factor BamB